jgi:hypothetical protein
MRNNELMREESQCKRLKVLEVSWKFCFQKHWLDGLPYIQLQFGLACLRSRLLRQPIGSGCFASADLRVGRVGYIPELEDQMKFKHEVRLIHSNGEATILSFWVRQAFGHVAQQRFRQEAKAHFVKAGNGMRRVNDTTVAGFHYANDDGTVVLELH